jgi:hypothetical protein
VLDHVNEHHTCISCRSGQLWRAFTAHSLRCPNLLPLNNCIDRRKCVSCLLHACRLCAVPTDHLDFAFTTPKISIFRITKPLEPEPVATTREL